MKRRTVLRAAGGGLVAVATAGCSGLLDDADEIESLEAEIDDLEDKIDQLEADLDDRDDQIRSLEDEIDDLEAEIADREDEIAARDGEIDDLESDIETLETEILQRLADRYEDTSELFDTASLWLDEGDLLVDDEEYHDAARFYMGASRYMDVAYFVFEDLMGITSEYDIPEATELADAAAQHSAHLREAAVAASDGAREYGLGNFEEGDAYMDSADDHVDWAQEYEVATADEFASTLGL